MSKYLILLVAVDFRELTHEDQLEVYKEFYLLVYPLVNFIVKDHGETEDIIQEAFLRALEKSTQLEDWDKLESWLKTLTRNVTLNILRKFKRKRNELDEEVVIENAEGNSDLPTTPVELEVETKIMEESIAHYVGQLKPEYRQVFEMRWLHQMSYKEIARAMNISESIVKHKLYRAREVIKNRIEDDWNS